MAKLFKKRTKEEKKPSPMTIEFRVVFRNEGAVVDPFKTYTDAALQSGLVAALPDGMSGDLKKSVDSKGNDVTGPASPARPRPQHGCGRRSCGPPPPSGARGTGRACSRQRHRHGGDDGAALPGCVGRVHADAHAHAARQRQGDAAQPAH